MHTSVISYFKSALVALFVFLAPVLCVASERLPVHQISLKGADGAVHDFQVEVAFTPSQRERGLMERESMPANHGMLFVFPKARRVTMWMKDTYLPLDMIFLDSSHRVVHVKENAQPLDESIIDSGGDVLHVLEINAGLAKKLKITVGAVASGDSLEIKSSR